MARYLISYDLTKPRKDYSDLIDYLEGIGATRILESVWVLKNDATPADMRKAIIDNGEMDADDRLVVVAVTGASAWRNLLVSDAVMKTLMNG